MLPREEERNRLEGADGREEERLRRMNACAAVEEDALNDELEADCLRGATRLLQEEEEARAAVMLLLVLI